MADVRRVVERTPPAAIAAAQRGMAARPDVTSLLPQISVPTLILVGDRRRYQPARRNASNRRRDPQRGIRRHS